MKGNFVIMFVIMIVCVAVVFLTNCATVEKKVPAPVEEALTEPKVEVLEVKVEKTSMEKDALDNLIITGKAIYHPAKISAKAFKDYVWDIRLGIYDETGNMLFHIDGAECGEYGKEENVKPNEPFPFKAVTGAAYVGWDNFLKAKTAKVEYFRVIQ